MTSGRSPERRWTLALVAVTFVWGATFVVVQEAVDRLPVFPFNALRFAVATLALGALTLPQLRTLGRTGWIRGAVLGAALWAGYAFQTFGLTLTTAPKAGFITGMVVVLTPLFQALLLRRAPGRAATVGVVLATVGLALLTLEGSLVPSTGDLLVLLCAAAFALHLIGLGAWSGQHPVRALAVAQLATAALLHTAGGVVQSALTTSSYAWLPRSPYVWAAIVFTAVFASALAFFIQTAAQRVLSPARTAVIFTMEPVFAWLTSWLGVPVLLTLGVVGLQAETFGAREAAGAALILAGMLWSELRAGEPPDAIAATETAALTSGNPTDRVSRGPASRGPPPR